MSFGYRVGKLAGKLQNLAFVGAGALSLLGQVVWDNAPAATPSAFKDDFVTPLVSSLLSDPTRLSLTHDSGSQKHSGGTVPVALVISAGLRCDTEGYVSYPIARRTQTRKQGFVASGSETPALVLAVAQSLIGRSVASDGLTGVVTPLLAGNALPDTTQSQSSRNSFPGVVSHVNFGGNLEKQPLVPNSPPILAAPTPVWLAHYPFTGFSAASVDPDPSSTASSLVNIGLGYLKYEYSGNPWPAVRLDASDVPGYFMLGSYLAFTLTANPGYVLNLDEFRFDVRALGMSFPYTAHYQLRTSLDGFVSAVVWGSVTSASGSFTTVTTPLGPSFTNLGSIEFRLLFSDSNNGAKNYILVDNITVVGATVLVPEPEKSVAFAGLVLVGLAALRKVSKYQGKF